MFQSMQATAAIDIYEECRRNEYKEPDGEYHPRAVFTTRIKRVAPEVTYFSLAQCST